MRNKSLSLALILMLVCAIFVLTGCGETSNEEDVESDSEEETTQVTQVEKRWYWSENEDGEEVITDGEIELHIGDTVNYDEQTQIGSDAISSYISKKEDTGLSEYESIYVTQDDQKITLENNDVDWVVLGLDEETGEILITSNELVYTDENLNSNYDENYYILYGEAGYENGVDELNNICEMFGYGEGATGARSMTQDDVDTVLGYDFEEDENAEDEGVSYTFYWNGTNNPSYETSTGKTGSGFGTGDFNFKSGFRYYDNGWHVSEVSDTATEDDLELIATITNKYSYYYYCSDLVSEDSNEYKVIALSKSYWLANQSLEDCMYWGLRRYYVSPWGNSCTQAYFVETRAGYSPQVYSMGIRPVVSLSSDIELSGNSSNGWEIE